MTQAAAARLLFLAAGGTAGAPPAVAWQARFQGSPRIEAVAVDRGVAALVTVPTPTHDGYEAGSSFPVVRPSGSSGDELWRYQTGGNGECETAAALLIDAAGDVVAGG